jgi:hypothetical protein
MTHREGHIPPGGQRVSPVAAAILEFMGYHQILAVERFVSMFQIRRKRGTWGKMRRAGIAGSPPTSEPFEPEVVTHATDIRPGAVPDRRHRG